MGEPRTYTGWKAGLTVVFAVVVVVVLLNVALGNRLRTDEPTPGRPTKSVITVPPSG